MIFHIFPNCCTFRERLLLLLMALIHYLNDFEFLFAMQLLLLADEKKLSLFNQLPTGRL
jgi:hypothetical protein